MDSYYSTYTFYTDELTTYVGFFFRNRKKSPYVYNE